MAIKKDLKYYLGLNWTYTIETESHNDKVYYVISVNELPGVCTDAKTIPEGMKNIKEALKAAISLYLKQKEPIPEPIDKKKFKGNIAYRTSHERHYLVAKVAKKKNISISKAIDYLVDEGISKSNIKRKDQRG